MRTVMSPARWFGRAPRAGLLVALFSIILGLYGRHLGLPSLSTHAASQQSHWLTIMERGTHSVRSYVQTSEVVTVSAASYRREALAPGAYRLSLRP